MSDKPRTLSVSFSAAVFVFVTALYVLSSGPTRRIGVESRLVLRAVKSSSPVVLEMEEKPSEWWSVPYRPLLWASEQPWGAALRWYWDLFPAAPYQCG